VSRRRSRERGQGLAEIGLVLPIIVLLLIAVFDMGRAVYAYNTITDAARQGARVAVVNQLYPGDADAQCSESMPVEDSNPTGNPTWSARACAAASALALGVGPSQVAISYSPPSGVTLDCPAGPSPSASAPFHVGCMVSVTVTYQWAPITPLIGTFIGPITMQATSKMPIERVFP
jgi:Flp pilus assembly protein TadG